MVKQGGEIMSLKIKEEVLQVENLVGKNSVQTVLQSSLVLPGALPSIERIVWINGEATVIDIIVAEDRVIAEGYIDLQMVYLADDLEQDSANYQVVPWPQAIAFSDYVEVIGAEPGMLGKAKLELLGIEWELQPDQRTINVDVLTQLTALVKQQDSLTAVTGVTLVGPQKIVVNDLPLNIQALIGQETGKLALQKTLTLPENYGPMDLILELNTQLIGIETTVTKEQIKVEGKLGVSWIYAADTGAVYSFAADELVPFETTVPNNTGLEDLIVVPDLRITNSATIESGKQALTYTASLFLAVDLYQINQIRAIVDITGSSGCVVEVRKTQIQLDNYINDKTQQASAQGVLEITDGYPPIREILSSKGEVQTTDYRIDEDKVILEGTISLEIAYLAYTDEELKPLYCKVFRNAIPFQQVIALGGVEPGMTADVTINIRDIRLDLINRETIEADVVFRSTVKVSQPIQTDIVVEALEVAPPEEDPPSITYVFVQNGDTLWKLSKKYHTSLEAILNANYWLKEREEYQLRVGDKICIPRKS